MEGITKGDANVDQEREKAVTSIVKRSFPILINIIKVRIMKCFLLTEDFRDVNVG